MLFVYNFPTQWTWVLFIEMTEEKTIDQNAELFPEESLKEVVEAGVFYGRRKSKTNPRMKPFILANRGGIEIINLYKTLEDLTNAIEFVKEKAKGGGMILLVGTQPAAYQKIEEMAKEFNYPFVVNRWLGGTLTNFKIISKRVEYLKKLRHDSQTGGLDKYTKKEKGILESKMRKLEELLGGLENLTRLPDLVLVIDPEVHKTAVREAKRLKIPVLAFANVDSDPDQFAHFVVGNNKAKKSVDWFLDKISDAIREGKAAAPVVSEPVATSQ